MKTRIGFIFGMVVLFTLVNVGTLGFAADNKYTRPTLRGLNGVYVLVESLKPEIEKKGLTKQQIRTDVELKLRLAGIKVLTDEEWLKEKGGQALVVSITLFKTRFHESYADKQVKLPPWGCRENPYGYTLIISLMQNVYLSRNSFGPVGASTWSAGNSGITTSLNKFRNEINDLVDEFINAYLSENPKQEKGK